jgi:hypothetical protein
MSQMGTKRPHALQLSRMTDGLTNHSITSSASLAAGGANAALDPRDADKAARGTSTATRGSM